MIRHGVTQRSRGIFQMSGLFLKAGAFAALCGVKKDTLFHYDQIGILKPEKVDEENGYRYYSVKQLYTFDLIAALKRLGMSLREIKAYLDRRSPGEFLELLRVQQSALEEERLRLEAVGQLLRETIAATELSRTVTPGTIRLETLARPERYLAVTAADYTHFDEQQFLLRSRELLQQAREHGSLAFPPGDIVTRESLEQNRYVEDYHFCRVDPGPSSEHLMEKPAGTYAVLYHQGSYGTLEQAYATLAHWVKEQGYQIIGNLYEEDLLHYMSSRDPSHYLMRISIQVDPEQA